LLTHQRIGQRVLDMAAAASGWHGG
jgi:hypothetical protein